ncbi:MAG: GIY-YIG nuclease family protein [Candidatus Paceibacterota bacterium]
MINKNLKKLNIPDKPGVYFFKRGKEIFYIGKATSLKDRVKSYFGKDLIETRGPALVDMVLKADKIDWEATDSVLEALILEANFIKKYQPKYNTKEKSDKSFNYVVITKEKLPKVLVVRGRVLGNYKGNIFGPFTSGSQLSEALKILRRIFPFIDNNSSKKQNYEFYKQLGLTPDALSPSKMYLQNIKYLKLFFNGKKKDIIRDLKKFMMQKAREKEFEKAQELKRQLFALQHINDVALLKNETMNHGNYSRFTRQNPTGSDTDKNFHDSLFRIEAYDVAHLSGKNMVGAMVVLEDREVVKNEYRKFKIKTQNNANDTGALAEILSRRFIHREWVYPNLIVVDGGIAQINVARRGLASMGIKIPIVSVVKDEKHKPKAIIGNEKFSLKYKREILLANSEAHRFAIAYHKNMRNKNFLR